MMKRFILLIITLLITLTSTAPTLQRLTMITDEPVKPFEKPWIAVYTVESGGNDMAYNQLEEATGRGQIRPIRVADYNKRTGKRYLLRDMYRPEVSREVFMYYATQIGPYDIDLVIRKWNGSGPMTYEYLKAVKAVLREL